MALKVTQSGGGDFEMVPAGQYTARCYRIIDLGTQETVWQGETKLQHKVMVYWEILDEPRMSDGRPFAVSKQYTASLNENSHLYKDLVAWRGKEFSEDELLGFDISKLLGAYCQIQVVHAKVQDKTYANVNAIMGTKEKPEGVNDNVMFDIDHPDMEVFESLTDWLKTKIRASQEWQAKEAGLTTEEKPKDVVADVDLEKDISISDLDDKDNINLDDIPF
jgi:hypothetical protein